MSVIALLAFARRYWPFAIIAGLSIWIGILKLDVARVRLQAANSHTAFLLEKAAFGQTVANFRRATTEAQAADAEHARRSEQAQVAANEESDRGYQDALAALRARYDRLRDRGTPRQAVDGGGSIPAMPAAGTAAGGPDDATPRDRLLDAALIADQQALQLGRLIEAVKARDAAFGR